MHRAATLLFASRAVSLITLYSVEIVEHLSGVKTGCGKRPCFDRNSAKYRFPQGLKPADSVAFMYGLKPVPFKLKPRSFRISSFPQPLKPASDLHLLRHNERYVLIRTCCKPNWKTEHQESLLLEICNDRRSVLVPKHSEYRNPAYFHYNACARPETVLVITADTVITYSLTRATPSV